MTHADRIRAMTDEELAEMRADNLCYMIEQLKDILEKRNIKIEYSRTKFVENDLCWLKQEANEKN